MKPARSLGGLIKPSQSPTQISAGWQQREFTTIDQLAVVRVKGQNDDVSGIACGAVHEPATHGVDALNPIQPAWQSNSKPNVFSRLTISRYRKPADYILKLMQAM